ncbi:MAG: hypothetical protein F6K18_07835 [Okeania sp. SIO2C2]|uniref:hypothetical protein n=1 Tax=Okeania sp. SIO2C2 TaxID=2607787 RepID=UPI0013B914F9|nr:hypothetical protein [Okeania sp. SIO2C2]NEP86748.1 hypothetical protein [Okeania sp. SIO2C2]
MDKCLLHKVEVRRKEEAVRLRVGDKRKGMHTTRGKSGIFEKKGKMIDITI